MIKNDVITGDDGWLFLNSGGQKQRDHLTGKASPSVSSIRHFKENILSRYEYCLNLNIPYLHFVFPTKDLVATTKLGNSYSSNIQSLFDRCYRECFGNTLPRFLLYPLKEFQESDHIRSNFMKLDTHLSASGRLMAVKNIMSKLNMACNPMPYFFEKKVSLGGDLAVMQKSEERSEEIWWNPVIPTARMYDNRKALQGNTNNIILCANDLAVFDKRLLIFGDSFIAGCIKYLSVFFKDIMYIRTSSFQTDMISLYSPDVVISANAERYLSYVARDNTSHSIMFDNYGSDTYQPSMEFSDALRGQLSFKHHHNVYYSWRKKFLVQPIFIDDVLGPGFANNDISINNASDRIFDSIGNDPQIIFPRAGFNLEGMECILIEVESEINSISNVFYTEVNNNSYPFSRKNMIERVIKTGPNSLIFKVRSSQFTPLLRFDPVSGAGRFQIKSISVR